MQRQAGPAVWGTGDCVFSTAAVDCESTKWYTEGRQSAVEHETMTAKEKIRELIETQPDDSSYDEILRELAFERMVERGLSDIRNSRVVSNEEMGKRIQLWQS